MSEGVEKMVKRWRCGVAYDGTGFSGWQSQPDGNAVQDLIERRLGEIFGEKLRIHGSGRTDAGVHARGQVFHFDGGWRHGGEKLVAALRVGVPEGILVKSAVEVPKEFHARFSAVEKTYCYEIFNGGVADPFIGRFCWSVPRKLDVEAMRRVAELLVGERDFRAFSAFGGEVVEDTVRDLRELRLVEKGRRLRVVARADGFLYKMVRSLVGALVHAGRGRLSAEEVRGILKKGERTELVETAPAKGLCLMRVRYAK